MTWKPTLLAALLLAAPALAQAPEPAVRVTTTRVEARVESVNQATREVVLAGEGGRLVQFVAGPEVRNLAQVRPGDRVIVAYREAIALAMARPGSPAEPEGAIVAGRAAPGERPAGAVGEAVRVRVRIIAVNPQEGRVTFQGPGGQRSVVLQDATLRAFAASLAPGDEVDVTLADAIAVTVEPARRR
jgi:carbon monoxide dehydrogenase subunit G